MLHNDPTNELEPGGKFREKLTDYKIAWRR